MVEKLVRSGFDALHIPLDQRLVEMDVERLGLGDDVFNRLARAR